VGAWWGAEENSKKREGQTLFISGEPGIGKTRLLREIATHAEVSGGRALVGECFAEGNAPYSAFGQMVRRALRHNPQGDLDLAEFVLADLISIAPELRTDYPDIPPNPPLGPESEQRRLFENLVTFCKVLTQTQPLLLVIDDIHWADSGTLNMLLYLIRRTKEHPVMILATYREVEMEEVRPFNEVLTDLIRKRMVSRLKLARLERLGTQAMLTGIFAEEITPRFLEDVHRETDGNPLFIEEICRALVESGKLYFEDGKWRHPDMEEIELPQGVRMAIQSRVNMLSEEIREVLLAASIIGREFDFSVLHKVTGVDEIALIDNLEEAIQAQFIEELRVPGVERFTFVHALIPPTMRESLSGMRRRRLHRRIAEAIEQQQSEAYEVLAHHYGEAGIDTQALKYYTKTGERALGVYSYQEAEKYFGFALDLTANKKEKAQIMTGLGEALFWQTRYGDAVRAWRRGIEIYQEIKNLDRVAWLYARCGRAMWDDGDNPGSLGMCREGLDAVQGAPDSEGVASLLNMTAMAGYTNNLMDEVIPLAEKAYEMAERVDSVRGQVEALIVKSFSTGSKFEINHKKKIDLLNKAIELAESKRMLFQAGRAYNMLGNITFGDDPLSAVEYLQKGINSFHTIGAVGMEILIGANAISQYLRLGNMVEAGNQLAGLKRNLDIASLGPREADNLQRIEGSLMGFRGEWEKAVDIFFPLWESFRETGRLQNISGLGYRLGEYYLELGRNKEAEEVLLAIKEYNFPHENGALLPLVYLAVKCTQEGELEEARKWLDMAYERYEEPLFRNNRCLLHCSGARARLLAAERRWEEAWAAFEELIEIAGDSGFRHFRGRHLFEWGKARLERGEEGDHERGKKLMAEALGEFEDMGAPGWVARIGGRIEGLGF
jgi:tetratricopeptide (TPR) repeat protein